MWPRASAAQASDDLFDGLRRSWSASACTTRRSPPCRWSRGPRPSTWGPDGRLTHWTGTQRPHAVRDELAAVLGVRAVDGAGRDARRGRRLRGPDVPLPGGDGDGLAGPPSRTAAALGRDPLGEPAHHGPRPGPVAGRRHRKRSARAASSPTSLSLLQDAGAYPEVGALLPGYTMLMASGTYAIPRIEVRARSVVTNTASVTAFRGAGRPEATAAIERAIDLLAAELAMDPVELRRRNVIPPGDFPYQTVTGATYDSGDYAMVMDRVLERGRLRMPARRAVLRRARRRSPAARHRARAVHRDHQQHAVSRSSPRSSCTAGGRRRGPHRRGTERPGTRHRAGHAGERPPRGGLRRHHGRARRYRRRPRRYRHRGLQLPPDGRHRPVGRRRRDARARPAALGRAARGGRGGRGLRPPAPAVSTSPVRRPPATPGPSWRRPDGPPLVDRRHLWRMAVPTFPFGAHLVVVEVDIETGKVRSNGSSPATTPGGS